MGTFVFATYRREVLKTTPTTMSQIPVYLWPHSKLKYEGALRKDIQRYGSNTG